METIKKNLGDSNDAAVILNYINFVGEAEVLDLVSRFRVNKFVGRWEQVLTSISTGLLGSGILYSSVNATYSLQSDGNIKVVNAAYDQNFEKTCIEGSSRSRSVLVPTCRTVTFNNSMFEGNYWIIYISQDFTTFIVSAPIIVGSIDISSNFGMYVLTKDREKFWNSSEPQNVFNALKKYGFTQFWNFPVNSGKSFTLTDCSTKKKKSSNRKIRNKH